MGKALMQLLDNSDSLIGKPLRVGLHDVSTGGTSFMLRITQEEKASLMLGRKLVIQFSSADATPPLRRARFSNHSSWDGCRPLETHDPREP